MSRWSRLSKISEEEKSCLELVTDNTPGLSIYGNKARAAVMFETDIAYMLSLVATDQCLSVGELCSRLVRESFEPVSGTIAFGGGSLVTVDKEQLILNLTMKYGGFVAYDKANRLVFRSVTKTKIKVGNVCVALLKDNMQKILSLYDQKQVFWYREDNYGQYSIGVDLREISDGYIVLASPIEQHLYDFLQQATIQ